jgi:phytol kinase
LAAFKDGHDFGTVFYSITLTALLYFFFDHGWIIQAAFLPLVFGDAMANIFGVKYGRTPWKFVPSKTVEGSLAAFTSSSIVLLLVLSMYKLLGLFPIYWYLLVILSLLEAMVATLAELISPYGLDNLTIPVFCTSIAIWIGSFSPNIVVFLG